MKTKLLLLLMIFTLLFTGCSDGGSVIKYDIPAAVQNLDPQFATTETARMVISNTFEGLFRQLPTGEVVPCLSESYSLTDDGLTYTFHLRKTGRWSNGDTVTAHDFAFALSRLFDSTAFSPYAGDFSNLKNAAAILAGTASRGSLGVRALDDFTLEISLTRPDSRFLELLASTPAMPCQQAFFESTRARYGLGAHLLIYNGPFQVSAWDSAALGLRRNKHYDDPPVAVGVNLYIVRDGASPSVRFLAGETDASKVDFSLLPQVQQAQGTWESFSDTVWVLVFNQRYGDFSNVLLRRSLAQTVDRELFAGHMGENLASTAVLIPPAVATMGTPFRDTAGSRPALPLSPESARAGYIAGLEAVGGDRMAFSELTICSDNNQPMLAGYVQQGWERTLSLSTGMVRLSREELIDKVYAGEYQAAIIPISASYSSPNAILSYFRSDSKQNFTGYENEAFDRLLDQAATAPGDQADGYYAQAERMLLEDAVVVPLFFETSYYAMSKGVSGVEFSPFLSSVSFRHASKAS